MISVFFDRLLLPLALLVFASCSAIASAQGTDLGGGIIARSDVESYADLSLDLRDIRSYNSSAAIREVYDDGRHANDPKITDVKSKLKDIPGKISNAPTLTPNHLFQLYGLSDLASNSIDGHKNYAENFIESTMNTNLGLTAEAIMALSLWMYGTHLLLWGVDNCAKRSVADNPDMLETLDGGGWDEFIALWIGKYQSPASSEGHGLYSWAQEIGEKFGMTEPEANANTQLKLLYQQGAGILSMPNACSRDNTDSVQQLWTVGQQMISQMFVPLFQRLINAIDQSDEGLATLYATALIPQISQCRSSAFKKLNEHLMGGSIDFNHAGEIMEHLHDVLSCFGLSCEDIGKDIGTYAHLDNCKAREDLHSKLAGYLPSTDVKELSKIDLDILQLRILSSMERSSNEGSFSAFLFPKYMYNYGKNSIKTRYSENDPVQFLSLHELATSTKRQVADPFFKQFESYFDKKNYADEEVTSQLTEKGKWETATKRMEAIVTTSAYQIVFMSFLTEMSEAVEKCENPDPNWDYGATHPWDEVAALLIGSLEAPERGGSLDQTDGQLIWSLGNGRAFQFQRINKENYAEVNSEILDLLFAGKGELDAQDCNRLRWTVNRLAQVATIPMVQSAIRYAITSQELAADSNRPDLVLGETFSLSVLPILTAADRQAAEVIEENMVVKQGVQPVQEGAQVVAEAFAAAMAQWGVDCHDLGSTSEVDPCKQNPRTSSSVPRPAPAQSASPSVRVGLGGLLMFTCFGVIVNSLFLLL